jgi:hypothetical protein
LHLIFQLKLEHNLLLQEQLGLKQEKQLERQMELLERQFERKDFQERIMAEAWRKRPHDGDAVPGPSGAAGAARDPRQKPRERERRRIPEGWVEAT